MTVAQIIRSVRVTPVLKYLVVDGEVCNVFQMVRCSQCDGKRPHHGPFCCSCGHPNECWPGCAEQGECRGCDRPLCIDHSPDFYGCDATGDWHDACHDTGCGTCQDQSAREWVEEHRW